MSANKPDAVPCDFCSDLIPAPDFDRGKAVVLLKKKYCTKCMTEAISRVKDDGQPPSAEFQTPRPSPLGDGKPAKP